MCTWKARCGPGRCCIWGTCFLICRASLAAGPTLAGVTVRVLQRILALTTAT
jgi:hypothetical protein